jgi:serine/threonine-protein kinase
VLRRVDSRRKARIEQEAVLREGLTHPNLVRADRVIEVDGQPGLVMDYVEGPTLQTWLLNDLRADLGERLLIFRGIVEGCRFAHQHGLVHRDLKPSNVLLQPAAGGTITPRVGDFGIAKALEPEVGRYGGLTTVNTGLGTAGYAAPEQVRDAASVDHRADLCSLGCILYELVCGIGPFAGLSAFDTLQAQRDGRCRRPEEIAPGLPVALYDLVRQLMAVRPEERPLDCDEVLRRLDRIESALQASPATLDLRPTPVRDLAIYAAALCSVPLVALAIGTVFSLLA